MWIQDTLNARSPLSVVLRLTSESARGLGFCSVDVCMGSVLVCHSPKGLATSLFSMIVLFYRILAFLPPKKQ